MAGRSRPYRETMLDLMRAHDVTVAALADWVGISHGHLSNTLRGHRPAPPNEILERIAVCLRVAPDVFLEYRERRVRAHTPSGYAKAIDRLYERIGPVRHGG